MASALVDVFEGRERWAVAVCDNRFALAGMPSNSVDAVVCDPPYGLSREPDALEVLRHWLDGDDYEHGGGGFMGKTWDSFVPGPSTWREIYRVLKPGGHVVAFGGTRTFDLMVLAIRIAGFEIRDALAWLYGSGFPKSLNVSKAIDSALGAAREPDGYQPNHQNGVWGNGMGGGVTLARADAVTPEARKATGYGTALKPAFEPVTLARKPLAGTVAATFMEHGTGALNIDGCRIGWAGDNDEAAAARAAAARFPRDPNRTVLGGFHNGPASLAPYLENMTLGRWPANVILGHSEACERRGTKRVRAEGGASITDHGGSSPFIGSVGVTERSKPRNADGTETVEDWQCVPDCPVRLLDEQAGDRPGMSGGGEHSPEYGGGMFGAIDAPHLARGDTGGPSRFFYTSKASRAERDAGLDDFDVMSGGEATGRKDGAAGTTNPRAGSGGRGGSRNLHATVKPIDLMRWLVRLVSRPGALILDPFAGSGTTGIATMLEGEGRRFVGLELDPRHVDIARARIAHVVGGTWKREVASTRPSERKQTTIFDMIGGTK